MFKCLLVVFVGLALAGCSTAVVGSPVAVPSSSAVSVPTTTKVPRSDVDAELIELRKIDSCALLDPKAAVKVAGGTPARQMPSSDFAECKLELADGRSDGWAFRAIVGSPWIFGKAPKERVAGLSFARVKSVDDYCDFSMRYKEHSSITLSVERPYEDRTTDPCAIARKFLEAVAAAWQRLPQRDDGLTSPEFPLAAVDPCDAADLDKNLGWIAHPISPYQCQIGMGADTAVVVLTLDSDPESLASEGARNATAITVGDRPGAVADDVRGGKEVRVRFADHPSVEAFASHGASVRYYQVISVAAGNEADARPWPRTYWTPRPGNRRPGRRHPLARTPSHWGT